MQAAVWFTSFDLAQGYLQMAMEEADIPKLPFVRVLAVCSNLPACHSGLPMPEPHFAG